MRFLRWFITVFFVLVFGVGGSFLLVRELLLIWAEYQLESDIRLVQRTNTWASSGERCLTEAGAPPVNLQLRFLNSREYVLEVACEGASYFAWSPIKTLPWQVKKTTGTAGVVVLIATRSLSGEITLSLWGQNKLIVAEGEAIQTSWGKSSLISDSIVSSCQAHGLTCCDPVREAGTGDLFSRAVNDCQTSCYTACVRRPNLLFFQTDPPADPSTRQVKLSRDNTFMLLSYTFEERAESPIKEVIIEFGDGTQETFNTATGKVTKEYSCEQTECHYTARISAVDGNGISSPDLRINELEIVIQ